MSDDLVILGQRYIFGGEQPFGISREDRRQHAYCVGKTGTGKSSLAWNWIVQDIYAGRGVGLIDPHGDLAESLLDQIPSWRSDHVIYFNPADQAYPVAFNLLAPVPPDSRHLVASGLVTGMKNIFGESWGPRLEYILYFTVGALLECENVSILGVQRMLSDEDYRAWVVKQIKDPIIRAFWEKEFALYEPRFMREAVAPVQNKVGQLLTHPIRNVLGQVKSKIDPAFIMNNRRIFIANLSKGKLGEDKANLLGSMLVTQFQLAAMARADMPEEQREDFTLVVDEFQNYAGNSSFASILSESRKYRLSLLLLHQYLEQLSDPVRNAVFGNCGTMIAFRSSESNAAILAREFGNVFSPSHFSSLDNFEVCVRLMSDGRQLGAFTGRTLPQLKTNCGKKENLIRHSRERHAAPRSAIEAKILRWMRHSF